MQLFKDKEAPEQKLKEAELGGAGDVRSAAEKAREKLKELDAARNNQAELAARAAARDNARYGERKLQRDEDRGGFCAC